jgi:hypothetical protein
MKNLFMFSTSGAAKTLLLDICAVRAGHTGHVGGTNAAAHRVAPILFDPAFIYCILIP